MGATRFDGPTGQFREKQSTVPRRSSLSYMNSDLKKSRDGSSAPASFDRSRKSSSVKGRTKVPAPRITYTLRTIPPKATKSISERPQLSTQHVPGSYHSARTLASEQTVLATSVPTNSHEGHTHKETTGNDHQHSQPIKAVDALHRIQDHMEYSKIPDGSSLKATIGSPSPSTEISEPNGGTRQGSLISHRPKNSKFSEQGRIAHDLLQKGGTMPDLSPSKTQDIFKESAAYVTDAIPSSNSRSRENTVRQFTDTEDLSKLPPLPDSPCESSGSSRKTTFVRTSERQKSLDRHEGVDKPSTTARDTRSTSLPTTHGTGLMEQISLQEPLTESNSTDSIFMHRHQRQSESLTRAITDLESLLQQALDIADRGPSLEHARTDLGASREYWKSQSDTYSLSRSLSDSSSSISDVSSNYQSHADADLPLHGRELSHSAQNLPSTAEVAISGLADRENTTIGDTSGIQTADFASSRRPSILPVARAVSTAAGTSVVSLHTTNASTVSKPSIRRGASRGAVNQTLLDHTFPQNSVLEPDIKAKPAIQPRGSSLRHTDQMAVQRKSKKIRKATAKGRSDSTSGPYFADFKNSALQYHPVIRSAMASDAPGDVNSPQLTSYPREDDPVLLKETDPQANTPSRPTPDEVRTGYTLRQRHHFSIREPHGFSLSRSHRRAPIARDWKPARKRFVASVTCINTALLGLIIGTYAGEVPAIQYTIADDHHYTILGNVVLFLGLAITTILFWPLPLLHGRKPYTMAALTLLMLLQFPQALVVASLRSPYVATYRVGILLPRALAGMIMGFANINFKTTLLDLFGASLQSGNPHQEIVNQNDVRRHGGGMGVWLGIWAFCFIGSVGIGFWIGASIISGLEVPWGFWITIILNAAVLLLNVVTPEVRRSAYRRSMAEVRRGKDVSRRIARGEIKMHLDSTGPIWWWEEVTAGFTLSWRMLKQPGFAVLAVYWGWIYGQVILVIVVSISFSTLQGALSDAENPKLLGALLSKYYYFHPQYVGLSVAIIPLGAILAMPFQKASLFSRSRHHAQRTDSMTFEKRVTWTSHLVRRAFFMITLPFAGLAYTLASHGPPTHYMVPVFFAGLIGFLSNLAIGECNGLIMETFDTSDLQPGMTGRPRRILPEAMQAKRTNFSCFPRVTAGFAIAQTCAFVIAAAATGWGGVVERHVGAQTATAVMAGVLLVLTLLLIGVLTRHTVVQIIPTERFGTNILAGPEDEWKPIIIGNPSGTTRRVSRLELGSLSRWSEIRRANRLGV